MDTIGFKETYIYCLIHNNEVRYVGKSDNPQQRFKEHLRLLKKKKHPNYKLQKSYNECQDIFLQYYPCTLYEGSIKEHREYAFETEFSLITSYSNDPKLLNINLDGKL